MHFLDILVLFKLNLGQISFNPAENVFATQQLTFLAISIAFYHIVTQACAEIKILAEKVTYVFRLFDFLFFFSAFLFFSFSFLFATVIDLLLGLLAVKKLLRKCHQDRQILAWSSQV